ncbi:hypothetical protein HYU95_04625 [Candidatus Daviesbacteria bacterium]|nr:hypothetical protein [Candidatus Daviesbacteria bacterium]
MNLVESRISRRKFMQLVGGTVGCLLLSNSCVPMHGNLQASEDKQRYLTLPFRKSDVNGQYQITEAWFYKEEKDIHDFTNHFAIDFHVPYGTPLLSPADSFVMSSYHATWVRNPDGTIRLWQGKEVGFGLGYFIQAYVPKPVNRFLQLAHLSEVDSSVPFSPPTYDSEHDSWNPTNHTLTIEELTKHPMVVAVKRGDPLGRIGFSGLRWGRYQEYIAGESRPVPIDPNIQRSWDEPHGHFEECFRDQQTGAKGDQRDPYDLNTTAEHYPQPGRPLPMGPKALWILAQDGLPAFAAA